jgi:DNA-binding transcriptional regulator YiaG
MTGDELKAARKALGMTQAQLAEALRTPLRTLHGWESGRAMPGVAEVAVRLMLQAPAHHNTP